MVAIGIFPVGFIPSEPGIPGLRFDRRECAGSVSEFARVVVPSTLPLDVGGRCKKMYGLCVCDRSSEGSGFSRVCDGKMPASEIGVSRYCIEMVLPGRGCDVAASELTRIIGLAT